MDASRIDIISTNGVAKDPSEKAAVARQFQQGLLNAAKQENKPEDDWGYALAASRDNFIAEFGYDAANEEHFHYDAA